MTSFPMKSYVLGVLTGVALVGMAIWIGRFRILDSFAGLTQYAKERGTLETKARFLLFQDGAQVGWLEKGTRLELQGNTDKITRFSVEVGWPEEGDRSQWFGKAPSREYAYLELRPDAATEFKK
jgi:hypothetical protein